MPGRRMAARAFVVWNEMRRNSIEINDVHVKSFVFNERLLSGLFSMK